MKKHLIFGAVLLAVLAVSCNKADIPASEPEAKGVPMTLTATIVSADTKVDVVDDETNKVLKCNWEIGDKVSVISLDASNKVYKNDIFEATAAGKTASFSGTFTGGSSPKVVVLYPALTEGHGTGSDDSWHSPKYNGDYSVPGYLLAEMYKGYDQVKMETDFYLQRTLNSAEDLEKYLLMTGEADLTDLGTHKLTVDLAHKMSILKLNLTFSTSEKILSWVNVAADFKFARDGYCPFEDITSFITNSAVTTVKMNLGNAIDEGITLSKNTATVYIPFVPQSDIPGQVSFAAGDKLTIGAKYNGIPGYSAQKEFTTARTLQEGRLYSIDVAF